jgi:regulatory protein
VRARPPAVRGGTPRVLDAGRARAVALDLLSRRPWTRRELGTRLRRRGAPAEVAETVVADLEARGYVDDRAYAAAWAESRARGRHLGSRRLREELLARGVTRALVDEAVGSTLADEEARARAAADRRLPALSRAAPADAARRLGGYLLRRGFPADVVRRVVRACCGVANAEE